MTRIFSLILAVACSVAVFGQPQSGKVYRIIAEDGRVLTTEGASREHDALLRMTVNDDKSDETTHWAVADAKGDGKTVTFVNPHTWMGIDQAMSTTNKWMLTWDAEQANSNQQFVIEEVEGGYLIGNSSKLYVRELEDGHIKMTETGTRFTFEEVECDVVFYPGASVRIVNKDLEQVIGTGEQAANDVPLVLEDLDETRNNQVWTLRRVSAANNSFILMNANTGFAMDMALQSSARRPLLWTASNTSSNQLVTFAEAEGGYMINNYKSSFYCVAAQEKDGDLRSASSYWETVQHAIWTFTAATPPVFERMDWQDESVFGINKMNGHAAFMPYRNAAAVKADAARWQKPWLDPVGADWMSLNGTWKFNYVAKAADRPLDFFEDGYDVSEWDDIQVPGCIEMQGYDRPMYVNVEYAFHDNPPYTNIKVSEALTGPSPVGSYRRTFTLPEGWETRRTILHFDGIYSGAYVWVNGKKVGYTQGGNMDAEFDVTQYVKAGENNVSVEVFRWTDGSYLEGQDMFHMSGIHRDVYIYSVPETYAFDHVIRADYSQGYDNVRLSVTIAAAGKDAEAKTFNVMVLSPDGNIVSYGEATMKTADSIVFEADIREPKMWSPEHPDLYTVLISQTDRTAGEEMAFATKYGFCEVTFDSRLVYVNGKREYFKGVNTQDTHPVTGRTFDTVTMWQDLTMMKRANINMVRTSHYPRTTKMNDMMAYLGLYVCDEADVECHKNWEDGGYIAGAGSWLPAMKDRWTRMVLRDRNNPAVVMWSMGNESGNGSNFGAGFDLIHRLDPTRPVHYEGATRDWNKGGYTDIRSSMYPTRRKIDQDLANPTQPTFYCEYEHAMGNSIGNLRELWDKFYDSPNGIGGCIWDWVDQSIYEPKDILSGDTIADNGFQKYRSGYDFPGPHQGNFVNNGIISANRAWSPELTAVKAVYQYIQFNGFDKETGKVEFRNRLTFSNLNDMYTMTYIVLREGVPVEEKEVYMVSVEPDEDGWVYLPIATDMSDGAEYTVQVEARLKEATPWAEAGYPMATAEYMLQERASGLPEVTPDTSKPFTTASISGMRSSNTSVFFAAEEGSVRKMTIGNLTVLEGTENSPVYNDFFWNENDTYDGSNNGNYSFTKNFTINEDKTQATYTVANTSTKCNSTFTYNIYSTGVIDLNVELTPRQSNLRRLGFSMNFPETYSDIEYYARGPWENYCDRCDGSYLQRVRTTVDDMYEAYAHPQSNGDHQDLRELRMVDEATKDTLVITTDGQVGFSLSRYKESQYLTYALHPSDLMRQNVIQAHFDYMVRGVGCKSCGGETAIEDYQCPSSGTYSFTLRFESRKYEKPDGVEAAKAEAMVRYADGVVTAEGQAIRVYDVGGAMVARGFGSVSLRSVPKGIYLVKAGGALYKFLR